MSRLETGQHPDDITDDRDNQPVKDQKFGDYCPVMARQYFRRSQIDQKPAWTGLRIGCGILGRGALGAFCGDADLFIGVQAGIQAERAPPCARHCLPGQRLENWKSVQRAFQQHNDGFHARVRLRVRA